MISGEWTPRYLLEHWVPSLVREAAPNARFLVMLRDPVERFVSGLRHSARSKSKLKQDYASLHYLRGLYFHQLQRWLKAFPKSRFLILQYEKCVVEPEHELQRTFEFLGLPAIPADSIPFKDRLNITRNPKSFSLGETHRRSLVDSYRDDVRDLLRDFPEIDGALWTNFAG